MQPAPFVSIITPVYNGAAFLDECILSVLGQTHQNWEYIIYNNCSTDATAQIAGKHAAADSRIRLIHAKEFVNSASNHNRALRIIAPEARYVKVIQADDRLYPECVERMVGVSEANPSVGVVGAFHLYGLRPGCGGVFSMDDATKPGREMIAYYLRTDDWVPGSPSNVLYRADIVRQSEKFYDESLWHDDVDAACRIFLDHDCGFVPQVLTFTRLHAGTQTTRALRVNTILPEAGRMLFRYGPAVLSPQEFKTLRRRFLKRYAWFLAKQTLRPWRYKDADYQLYHRKVIAGMQVDAGEDRGTQVTLAALTRLLVPEPHSPASRPQ